MDPVSISATCLAAVVAARRFFVTVTKHLAASKRAFLLDTVCVFAAKPSLAEQLNLVASHWTIVACLCKSSVAAFSIQATVHPKRGTFAVSRVQAPLSARSGGDSNNDAAGCLPFEPTAMIFEAAEGGEGGQGNSMFSRTFSKNTDQ